MDEPIWEPPWAGSESDHLVGMLDRLRWTFRWKVDGLTADQLRQTIPTSQLSLGVLLKHLSFVEDTKFTHVLFGTRPTLLDEVPDGTDPHDWSFSLDASDTANTLYTRWDSAVARSRTALARVISDGTLDEPAALSFGGLAPSRRRFVCDLVEEYGRHTGHADLLREAIDGRVGEDPPADWRPQSPGGS